MSRIKGRADKMLEVFAERVNKLARINLGATYTATNSRGKSYKKRIDSSGRLKDSLDYTLSTRGEDGKFTKAEISFDMLAYGLWVDKGRGKSSGSGTGKLRKNLEDWIRKKPLRMRDLETGAFVKMTDAKVAGLAYVIARRIHKHGIKPTNFFTEPFEEEFAKLGAALANAVGDEYIEDLSERIDTFGKTQNK